MIPYAEDSKKAGIELNDYEYKAKEIPWYHRVLLDRPSKVILVTLVLAIITPMLFYRFIYLPTTDRPPSDGFSTGSCLLPRTARLPCGYTGNQYLCHSQCCFDTDSNLCYHRFPSRFTYLLNRDEPWTENTTLRPRVQTVPFKSQDSFTEVKLSIDEISPTHMSLTFYNSKNLTIEGRRIEEKNYIYHISRPELNIIVNDTLGNNIFNTIRGPVIASENIWEVVFRLTEQYMFGLGEIPLRENTTKILYNHEAGLNGIPLIFSKTNDTFHGLLIDVIEPTEVTVRGENQIVIRSISKTGVKFHIFTGPKPKDIMKDVRQFLGFENKLQYWMLGAHICSENLITTSRPRNTHEDLLAFLKEASAEKLPFDSHCGTGPVVFENLQCVDDEHSEHGHSDDEFKNFDVGGDYVRSYGKRFLPHVAPYIIYKELNNTSNNNTESNEIEEANITERNCNDIVVPEFENLLIRLDDERYKGVVDDTPVVYPDYEIENAVELLLKFWADFKADGVLTNSWPLDESFKFHNETYHALPYFNEDFENAFNHTPQWNISRPNKEIYLYTHNQYGNHFANAFRNLIGVDIPIWATSPRFSGDIVSKQNVNTTWATLQNELTEAALGSISGNWLWSSPVCGDTEHFDQVINRHLCIKWYMAATYFPLLNIHSTTVRRDPLSFGGTDKNNILRSLKRRSGFLPYFYTTLQEGPLLRPMFYQFPSSKSLLSLRTQFSVGEYLLIVPNLHPDQTHVHIVMPPGIWYDIWGGLRLEAEEGDTVTMTTTEADFLTLIHGGGIVVMQQDVQETAEKTRMGSDYSLTVALDCKVVNTTEENTNVETMLNTAECFAGGYLYMAENMSIVFDANDENLHITAKGDDFDILCRTENVIWARRITELNIFGLNAELNNYDHYKQVKTTIDLCELQVKDKIVYNFLEYSIS